MVSDIYRQLYMNKNRRLSRLFYNFVIPRIRTRIDITIARGFGAGATS